MASDPARHTFLFADLVGFAALTDAHGDDRAVEVVVAMQERIRPLLPEHGAEEVKAIGDALMLRCEDPDAAVRLGVRIVAELEADPAFPPVRVGMHTGPAVARGGDWYGRTVNVAARLCSVAGGGEVLVSEVTRDAAGEIRKVEFGERGLHWLRNITEPVRAFSARQRGCMIPGRARRLAGRTRADRSALRAEAAA